MPKEPNHLQNLRFLTDILTRGAYFLKFTKNPAQIWAGLELVCPYRFLSDTNIFFILVLNNIAVKVLVKIELFDALCVF